MRRVLAILGSLLLASAAFATGIVVIQNVKALTASPAGANHVSTDSSDATVYGKPIDTGLWTTGSLQCRWSSLTGSVDATATLQATDDGLNWQDKSGAVLTLSGATGNGILSLTNITETNYRVNYAHNSVTGGLLSCVFVAKP